MVSRLSLRLKLLVMVLALAAVGLSGAAVATTASLHSYLVGRADDQLRVAAHGIADGFRFRLGAGDGGPTGGPFPGSSEPTTTTATSNRLPSPYYVRIYDSDGAPSGGPDAAPLTSQSPPVLPALTMTSKPVVDGLPFTVPSADHHGSWRVVAVETGDGTGVAEIATSLSDIDHTVDHLILIEVLIGAAILVLMGGGGYLLIRRSLAPLVAVERTAAAIAAGDLSRRVPDHHPRTEVGQLSNALNVMLGRIESAFAHERESQQQAKASEERMRQLVADASHELRTPLTSIRGFAELHRMGATDASDLDRTMGRIEDEAMRMGLLVDDLLLLARLDQERPIEQEPVDLLEIAHDVVEDSRRAAPDRSIELQADVASPPVVIGDAARLRQVVNNLMANALTHTPHGAAVTVEVSIDTARRIAAIAVSDTGPGLSAEDAERVFERFYRADVSRARSSGGSGLGLSIVAGLVAAHGGHVSVESKPGEGATFRVELPLVEP
ncbi:MAG TPA: HAMP domain-containing sensor histidine kinase [Mycobacteriales bacterium]|jgi:two-component system OmpR family sensor kinase|nr:HAMP domain-containing sensor histidine kinase [Mycobacteriales bacterium]